MFLPFGTTIEKSPVVVDVVAVVVPFTEIVAPTAGLLPESVTLPVTVFCAKTDAVSKNRIKVNANFFGVNLFIISNRIFLQSFEIVWMFEGINCKKKLTLTKIIVKNF